MEFRHTPCHIGNGVMLIHTDTNRGYGRYLGPGTSIPPPRGPDYTTKSLPATHHNKQMAEALRFECQPGCTECCRQKGFVYLTDADLPRMADFLGLTVQQFERKYVYRTKNRMRLRVPRDATVTFFAKAAAPSTPPSRRSAASFRTGRSCSKAAGNGGKRPATAPESEKARWCRSRTPANRPAKCAKATRDVLIAARPIPRAALYSWASGSRTRFGDHHGVFDADPAETFQVDARLDGDRHARREPRSCPAARCAAARGSRAPARVPWSEQTHDPGRSPSDTLPRGARPPAPSAPPARTASTRRQLRLEHRAVHALHLGARASPRAACGSCRWRSPPAARPCPPPRAGPLSRRARWAARAAAPNAPRPRRWSRSWASRPPAGACGIPVRPPGRSPSSPAARAPPPVRTRGSWSATERRISSISEADFTMRSCFDPPRHGLQRRLHRQPRPQGFEGLAGHAGRLIADATTHPAGGSRRSHPPPAGPCAILIRQVVSCAAWISKRGSVNRIARPREQQQVAVVAREARQVAQVGARGDQQGIQLAFAQAIRHRAAGALRIRSSWL